MKMKKMTMAWVAAGIIILGAIAAYGIYASLTPGKYVAFAQCLASKKVVFYGAFWCPHCQAQEAEFQMSRDALTQAGLYVECSTPDGKSQDQTCNDAGITGYPTWQLPDGTRLDGVQELSTLAQKSGCTLPS